MKVKTAKEARIRRHLRMRKRVSGTAERPRLSVFRSLKHIYAQLIDDEKGRTLTSASTLNPKIKEELLGKTKTEKAKIVGVLLGRKAKEIGVETAAFDRGGYKYHGRVKALAEGAKEAGLVFNLWKQKFQI